MNKEKEIKNEIDLGTFDVDVKLQPNGLFDVYISHVGSSGEHYTDVTADCIGELLAGTIECIAENYQNEKVLINEEELLKRAICDAGVDAVEDFLGHDLDSDDIDINSEMNDVIANMPEDVYKEYLNKYLH